MHACFKGFLASLAFVAAPVVHSASINPAPVSVTVAEGQTTSVQREVILDGIGPAASRIDVYFLADNTGSMGGTIYNVRNNAQTILDAISGSDPRFQNIDIAYGVASYNGDPREFGGDEAYRISRAMRLLQPITSSAEDTQSAIDQWRAYGGGDGPEANFFALHQLATNGGPTDGEGSTDPVYESGYEFGWRDNAVKLIVWFGDYRSHTTTVSRQEVIDALTDNNVVVAAINTRSETSGINQGGEAADIVEATDGYIAHNIRGADETIDAILNSVETATQFVDLSLAARDVPEGISIDFACASDEGCDEVAIGESRLFDMQVTGHTPGQYQVETYVPFLNEVSSLDNVTVRQCISDLEVRPSRSKISVAWTDSGADHYNVYRATDEAGPFVRLASTTNRYSTYGDRDVEAGVTYFYQVREADSDDNEYCSSVIRSTTTASRFRAGNPNIAPTIDSSPVTQALEDEAYQYPVQASDPEGSELSYGLSTHPMGMSIDDSGVIHWTPENRDVGEHSVVVTVSDAEGLSDTQVYSLTVENTNDAPAFSSTPTSEVRVGESYLYAAQAMDVDAGDSVEYFLVTGPPGMTVDSATGLVSWTPQYGDGPSQSVELGVRDEHGATDTQAFDILVTEPNRAPVIDSAPPTTTEVDTFYDYQVEASDPDTGDNVSFSLLARPDGMSIDANTGYITWTATADQVGVHTVSIQVLDGGGLSDVQTYDITVTGDDPEPNTPPEIESTPANVAGVGESYLYVVEATDSDGDTLEYGLVEYPTGMSIDGLTGELTWVPTADQVGTHSVVLEVVDERGAGIQQSFEVQVLPEDNAAPEIDGEPEGSVRLGNLYQTTLTATDPDGDALTFSLTTAPPGMTIDDSGTIEWTPTDPSSVGSHDVTARVTDARGAWAALSFSLTVFEDNGAPSIVGDPVTEATVDTLYSYDVDAIDPEGTTLTFSLLAWPGGMTIDPSTGLLEWTPAVSQTGSHQVRVQVSDEAGLTDTTSFTIDVGTGDIDPPYLDNTPTNTATVGEPYRYRIYALDNYGFSPEVELVSGPGDMTLDTSGAGLPELQWTPVEGDCIKTVTLRLSDAYGQVAEVSYDVQVYAAPKRLNRIQCSKQDESCGK